MRIPILVLPLLFRSISAEVTILSAGKGGDVARHG